MKSLVKSNGTFFPAIPSLFDDFFNRDWLDSSLADWRVTGATLPAVNVMETNDDFKIEVAAPGMKRSDFKVELDNNVLTISSERENKSEEKDSNGNYTKREFSYQSFQRSFQLPAQVVDADKIEAKYEHGLLHLVIPKKEEAKQRPPRMIQIS